MHYFKWLKEGFVHITRYKNNSVLYTFYISGKTEYVLVTDMDRKDWNITVQVSFQCQKGYKTSQKSVLWSPFIKVEVNNTVVWQSDWMIEYPLSGETHSHIWG